MINGWMYNNDNNDDNDDTDDNDDNDLPIFLLLS
jgi:hypothetical protein